MIAIVDYGAGNLASVSNMLKKVGYDSVVTSDISVLENADKIVLPGVGAFDTGMGNLDKFGLLPTLNKRALTDRIPVLGICLGMQLMCTQSEEGQKKGLNWVKADVKRFPAIVNQEKLRIPHIGWNNVSLKKKSTFFNDEEESRFYFVHSYYVETKEMSDMMTETEYGIRFCSSFQADNIIGVQFHPEKSHKYGMHLLKKFAEL